MRGLARGASLFARPVAIGTSVWGGALHTVLYLGEIVHVDSAALHGDARDVWAGSGQVQEARVISSMYMSAHTGT